MNQQGLVQSKQTNANAAPAGRILQRKCACGNHTPFGGACWECAGQGRTLQRKANNCDAPSDVPSIVYEVLRSPGQPLDEETRTFMEPRFGEDFSRVASRSGFARLQRGLAIGPSNDQFEQEANRLAQTITARPETASLDGSSRADFGAIRVHTGGTAADSAHAVGARAYTAGSHIVFGAGEYAPRSYEGRRLLAHELVHTLQQGHVSAESAAVIQRARSPVLDQVEKLLSYGVLDWAITDSEAMQALALLGTISQADLANQLTNLGSKYVTRLLDNLPDAAKTGEVYKRVIEAMGPAGVLPYATEQLSYGVLDWAITDAEVTRVFNAFVNLPAAKQEQFLVDLNKAGRLKRLISNSNAGHHALYIRPWISTLTRGRLTAPQRDVLRVIVSESDNLETLKLATAIRFDVTVDKRPIPGKTSVEWDPGQLRETYLVLDRLPEAHVARNKELLHLAQFKQAAVTKGGKTTITAGTYYPGRQLLTVNVVATSDFAETIMHETAHAVDKQLGWSTGAEPAKPKRGGWKVYGANYNGCSTDMVDDSGGAIKTTLAVAQRGDVVNEMANAMSNRSATALERNIRNLAWFAGLSKADQRSVVTDRALAAIGIGLNQPWFFAEGGGEHLKDHVYQEAYPHDWVRYRHEARSRKVSKYQFRDPGEWFAEAYATYYEPDSRGKGAKLADKDPDTKRYFDSTVDTLAPSR